MSILIKGMEMPKCCTDCELCDGGICLALSTGRSFAFNPYPERGRVEGCPLVPVPPHGRLIDADAFEKHIKEDWEGYDHWIAVEVENRPTVIEAEEAASEER